MIVSTEHALAGLRAAARRGVRIRLLSLSSDAPDDALQLATHLMPWAVLKEADELRQQFLSHFEQLRISCDGVGPPGLRADSLR
jgi:hypothetical protein